MVNVSLSSYTQTDLKKQLELIEYLLKHYRIASFLRFVPFIKVMCKVEDGFNYKIISANKNTMYWADLYSIMRESKHKPNQSYYRRSSWFEDGDVPSRIIFLKELRKAYNDELTKSRPVIHIDRINSLFS